MKIETRGVLKWKAGENKQQRTLPTLDFILCINNFDVLHQYSAYK